MTPEEIEQFAAHFVDTVQRGDAEAIDAFGPDQERFVVEEVLDLELVANVGVITEFAIGGRCLQVVVVSGVAPLL